MEPSLGSEFSAAEICAHEPSAMIWLRVRSERKSATSSATEPNRCRLVRFFPPGVIVSGLSVPGATRS